MTTKGTSPASSGPAGAHFEGQVGAYYLLSMLTGTGPRGLPGTAIDRIEFQRAPEGRALDDVIVHAHDGQGELAILEIQVKRSCTFTPADPVFRAVMNQIAEASRRPDFWNGRYELAIAISRTSHKIDGAYKDVLKWAREVGSAATFVARIERPGSANDDMRTFVRTFRSHLREAGVPDDDETVWRLLRKFQILVFDFTAQGSASEELAKERAVRALHPDEAFQASNLWASLVELAIQVAASGGDRSREELNEDLRLRSFRLVGDRRHSSARAALAEASRNALADIGDRVGDTLLTRHERVTAVHAALDEGRYVEIRGDAGVGKSGVLKHFAEQLAAESQVIVLSPGRTIPKGWVAMRAVIGFEGTIRELLSDLASDGGTMLFLDNLDFFNEEERKTVVDFVREAAHVPGFAVVATARRDFGVDEPNWLPVEALDRLGRAAPVMIGELNAAEIDELRHAAPRLAALLADNHPARNVTRNLFRLARLASRPANESDPRTEIDMAEQWWRTADGTVDGDYRERARLLRALAEQVLSRTELLDVSDFPPAAIDALIKSETLRDLGGDCVAFRHDVLREWAIANLLFSGPAAITRLPLDRPAPVSLARGVELAARMVLERASDGMGWQSLLDVVSRDGAHGSWRRAVLLALVRSEIGFELLKRVSSLLLAEKAVLLRELIRTTMAVDVQPASDIFELMGFDATKIPAGLNVPSGLSLPRLIFWLLSLGKDLPTAVIPDVVDLYIDWSTGMLGLDPLTPKLLQCLFSWLAEIENAREAETFRARTAPFSGELDYDQIGPLESNLRAGFLLFCDRTPELAAEYLRMLTERRNNDDAVRTVLKLAGKLAQAAPAELAIFTVTALIPKPRPDEHHRHRELEGPFDSLNYEFYPASPAQGPFFDLLTHAPEHGLSLIHRLVDHAITFYSNGSPYGSDAIVIPFGDGDRTFPWTMSYAWSRDGARDNCLTSALMALEAWAHKRIESGEEFDKVLADVVGPPDTPAAYVLVAVDLLLSHWPKSREVAIPFLACPELLCLDRERQIRDNFGDSDFFGLKALHKEPLGAVSLGNLKQRPSRRIPLEQLIDEYAVHGPAKLRDALLDGLRRAAERLGPFGEQSTLRDPAFMVVHALNRADPNNWHEVSVELDDGTPTVAHQYVSPEAEKQHLQALRDVSHDSIEDTNMQAALSLATDDPSRSSPELAAAGAAWAQRVTAEPTDEGTDEDWMREQAILAAAMIAMRDGDVEVRTLNVAWARDIFARALQTRDDPAHRFRSGLRFNPIAIAYVGLVHLLRDRATPEDVRAVLEVAALDNPAAAHGFGAAATTLATIDERLPRAVLRCAFAARVRPNREWDLLEEQEAERTDRCQQRIRAAVDAELSWLAGERPEPDWPTFPLNPTRPRHRLRLPGGQGHQDAPAPQRSREEEHADDQGAALWLRNTASIVDLTKRPWLGDIVRTYSPWTTAANGAGLGDDEEVANSPNEWNDAYFDLLANCLPEFSSPEVDELALTPICSLPDEPFFDVVTQFLRSVDGVYFNDHGLQEAEAVRIRSALARRLVASGGWRRLADSQSISIEVHIGPAIAAFFFNNYGYVQPANCYLLPQGIDRLDPFIPVLAELVEGSACFFVALVTLNLLEVSPKPAHLPFLVMAVKKWLASRPDDTAFWIDNEIGRRVCALIGGIRLQEEVLHDSEQALWPDIDVLLAALVRLGVAEASRLETALADS